jgi:hypothetical protein
MKEHMNTFINTCVGMAAIDSSAPETTSSDNSPTMTRRSWARHQGGPGSDSGSSGNSSDSFLSHRSREKSGDRHNRAGDNMAAVPMSSGDMRYNNQLLSLTAWCAGATGKGAR